MVGICQKKEVTMLIVIPFYGGRKVCLFLQLQLEMLPGWTGNWTIRFDKILIVLEYIVLDNLINDQYILYERFIDQIIQNNVFQNNKNLVKSDSSISSSTRQHFQLQL